MNGKDYIHNLIQNIENHLDTPNTIQWLAKTNFISSSQLYRDFYNVTGHTIKNYIVKRKMTKACMLLKQSDFSLVEIACLCGYDNQQSFQKAFKNTVHTTPLTYRAGTDYFYFNPCVNTASYQVVVSQEKFQHMAKFRFYDSSLKEIEQKALQRLLTLPLPFNKMRVFGKNGPQRGSNFCYELMLEPNTPALEPQLKEAGFCDVAAHSVPNGFYAKVTTAYNNDSILNGWNYLYNRWLPISCFEREETDYFEEYSIQNNQVQSLKLYLPVQKAKKQWTISVQRQPERFFLVSSKHGVHAEKEAANEVSQILKATPPILLNKADHLYLSKENYQCTCGVELTCRPHLPLSRLQLLVKQPGYYACIQHPSLNQYGWMRDFLFQWAGEYSIDTTGGVFAVYQTPTAFQKEGMSMYLPIAESSPSLHKMIKLDNTEL